MGAKNRERTFGGWLCCCLVAVFSGYVTWLICEELNNYYAISERVTQICVSLSSFSGGSFLESFAEKSSRILVTIFRFKEK